VWVLYRKSIYWPAKINNVYPREGKITYVFFPLEEKEQIFRTNDEKSIKAFVDYTVFIWRGFTLLSGVNSFILSYHKIL
jgi:hypothetical protein